MSEKKELTLQRYGKAIILNWTAAFFHLVLAVLAAVAWAQEGGYQIQSTVQLPVDRAEMLKNVANGALIDPVCDGKDYSDRSEEPHGFWNWSRCVNPKRDEASEELESIDYALPQYTNDVLGESKMAAYMCIFSVLTCGAHLLLVTKLKYRYIADLKALRQTVRWIEYSITSTIMMVAVMSLSGLTDIWMVLCYCVISLNTNIMGIAIEETPFVVKKLMFFASASLGFVLQWIHIWTYFYYNINPYLEANPVFWDIFGFILVLNVVLLCAYLTFPVCMAAQQYYVWKNTSKWGKRLAYLNGEIAFVILSFVAKGCLIVIILAASWGRGGDD